jgi:hypothetical protein
MAVTRGCRAAHSPADNMSGFRRPGPWRGDRVSRTPALPVSRIFRWRRGSGASKTEPGRAGGRRWQSRTATGCAQWKGAGTAVGGDQQRPCAALSVLAPGSGVRHALAGRASVHAASRIPSGDGCPAHIVKAPCTGGNVLAHARSRAQEVPEFVVTAAISSC